MAAPAHLSALMDAAAFARPLLRLRLPAALPLLLLLAVPPAACAAPRCLPHSGCWQAVAMMKRSAAGHEFECQPRPSTFNDSLHPKGPR